MVDALALIVAGDNENWYADSDRGGTDTPLDGELGLGTSNTVISRLRWLSGSSTLIINDNNSPQELDLGAYFGTGAGSGLSLYLQNDTSVVSFVVSDYFDTSGSNFLRLFPPADFIAIADSIVTGDRFIFAFAQLSTVLLEEEAIAGTPVTTGDLSIVEIENAQLSVVTTGIPIVTGNLTVVEIENAQLSGIVTTGTPVTTGDLSVVEIENVQLNGIAITETPIATGDLTVVEIEDIQFLGSVTAGVPFSNGDLFVVEIENASLSAESTAGNPSADVDLTIIFPSPEFMGEVIAGIPSAGGDLTVSGLILSDFDSTGLVVDVLALIVASGGTDFYRDSDRGGTDTPLDGELGLGTSETVISRLRWDGSLLILNDNNSPQELDIGAYLGTGGAGSGLSLYLQNDTSVVSFVISDHLDISGGNFIRLIPPADFIAIVNGISTGDRFIFALAQLSKVLLEEEAIAGTPVTTGDLSIVEIENAQLSGVVTTGIPIVTGNLTVVEIENAQLSGVVTTGIPIVTGNLTVVEIENAQLSGIVTTGTTITTGDLSVVEIEDIQFLGSVTAGVPSSNGDLFVVEIENASLSAESTAGNPSADVDLTIIFPSPEFMGEVIAGIPSAGGDLTVSGLILSDFDSTGLVVDVLALIVASGGTDFYRDSDRGGTDTPLDGELGLGTSETVISRLRWDGSLLILNDNNSPQELDIGAYLGTGGAGSGLSLYLQNDTSVVSFVISDHLDISGGNFIRLIPPADFIAIVNGISTGDRFIFALAQLSKVLLEEDVTTGNPISTGNLSVVEIEDAQVSGNVVAGSPSTIGILSVVEIEDVQVLGDVVAGSPSVEGDLTAIEIENASLVGEVSSGIPSTTGNLSVVDVGESEVFGRCKSG